MAVSCSGYSICILKSVTLNTGTSVFNCTLSTALEPEDTSIEEKDSARKYLESLCIAVIQFIVPTDLKELQPLHEQLHCGTI